MLYWYFHLGINVGSRCYAMVPLKEDGFLVIPVNQGYWRLDTFCLYRLV